MAFPHDQTPYNFLGSTSSLFDKPNSEENNCDVHNWGCTCFPRNLSQHFPSVDWNSTSLIDINKEFHISRSDVSTFLYITCTFPGCWYLDVGQMNSFWDSTNLCCWKKQCTLSTRGCFSTVPATSCLPLFLFYSTTGVRKLQQVRISNFVNGSF